MQPEGELPVIWPGVEEVQITHVNTFINQAVTKQALKTDGVQVDELVLTMGFVMMPVVVGQPAEIPVLTRALNAVAVRDIVRVSMTRHNFEVFVESLNSMRDEIARVEGSGQ